MKNQILQATGVVAFILLASSAHAVQSSKIDFNQLINESAHEERNVARSLDRIFETAKEENNGQSKELAEFLQTQVQFKERLEFVDNRKPNSILE